MAAIKLTGGFAGGAFLLYVLLRKRGGRVRFTLLSAVAGALFAALFYQRPWIATGNPCYPYLGGFFGAPEVMTSTFHHLLGTAKFASVSVVTLILLLPGLSFPALSRLFDGGYGLQLLLWSFLLLAALWRRPKRLCAAFLPIVFLSGAWLLTSPQARFLIPALAFFARAVRDAFPLVRGRAGRIFLWGAVVFSALCFPVSMYSTYGANLRATHHARRYIQQGRQLHTVVHTLVDVADSAQLNAVEGMCRRIRDTRQLQAVSAIGGYRRYDTELNALRRVLYADYADRTFLCMDMADDSCHHHGCEQYSLLHHIVFLDCK